MFLRRKIIYDEYGQTCNRFWSYVDSIGWAIVNNKKVVILFPESIMIYYDNFRNSKYISLPFWGVGDFTLRIIKKILVHNPLIKRFYKSSIAKSLGYISGWNERDSKIYYPLVKEQIIDVFRPNDNIVLPLQNKFKEYHDKGYFIVGLHIRRGDYKTYKDGIFYYDDATYLNYMQQVEELLKDKNVVFYISTNEQINPCLSIGHHVLEKPLNSASADLYALSLCDLIMGPPSTFSRWASFINDVPLCVLQNRETKISMSNFKIVV